MQTCWGLDIFHEGGKELFSLSSDVFQEGVGLPDYKLVAELLCFRVDIFQEIKGVTWFKTFSCFGSDIF